MATTHVMTLTFETFETTTREEGAAFADALFNLLYAELGCDDLSGHVEVTTWALA